MKITIAKNIRKLRESAHLTQDELGKRIGVGGATISSWEKGRTEPNMGYTQALADCFRITTDELIYGGYDDLTDRITDSSLYESAGLQYISVPLYNPICCGNGLFTDDEIINYVAVPADGLSRGLEYFAQVAKGNSMNGVGIEDGDLLIFQKTSSVDPGNIVCACVDDNEAMCKKYTVQNNMIVLLPANPAYDPIIVDPMSAEFHIVGLLKKSIKSF